MWQRVADKSGRENQWDQREKVTLQPKTLYGEAILKKWLEEAWNDILHKPPSLGSSNKIIYADMNRSQQRLDVKNWLHKCKAKHLDANFELNIDRKLTAGKNMSSLKIVTKKDLIKHSIKIPLIIGRY